MQEAPSAGRRLEAIQVARALAAMLVVGVHAIDLVKFRHVREGDGLGWLSGGRFYSDFGASGVDLFFVISGFVMAMLIMRSGAGHSGDFIRDRIARIIPLYWLMTGAMALLAIAVHRTIPLDNIMMSLSLWPLWNPEQLALPILFIGWTLAFEFAFYVVLLPALGMAADRRLWLAAALVGLCATWGLLARPAMDLAALFLNPIWFEFLIGIGLFALWRRGLSPRVARIAGLCGLLALGIGFARHIVPDVKHFAIFDGNAGALRALCWGLPYGLLLAALLAHRPGSVPMLDPLWRGLCHIGDASYSLYLVHPMLLLGIEYWLPAHVIAPDVLSLLGFGGAILLGLAVHRWIERPMLAAGKRRRQALATAPGQPGRPAPLFSRPARPAR